MFLHSSFVIVALNVWNNFLLWDLSINGALSRVIKHSLQDSIEFLLIDVLPFIVIIYYLIEIMCLSVVMNNLMLFSFLLLSDDFWSYSFVDNLSVMRNYAGIKTTIWNCEDERQRKGKYLIIFPIVLHRFARHLHYLHKK